MKRLAENLVCIILVTFCPKASKHRHFIIRGFFIEFAQEPDANNLVCIHKIKRLIKVPGQKHQNFEGVVEKADQRANCRNKKPKPDYKKVEIH